MSQTEDPLEATSVLVGDRFGNWFQSLGATVSSHPVINHEFLQRFEAGKFDIGQLQFWATQQFFFSISLPSAFAALYARVPNEFWKQKRHLVDLLKVEAWGSNETGCHSKHFIGLCQHLEIAVVKLTDRDCRPYTREYIDFRLELCLDPFRHLGEGLAAIAWGNELLNLHIFDAYRKGIGRIPGMQSCPTGYFDAHLQDEEHDAAVFQTLFRLTVKTDAEFQLAQRALIDLLDARVKFLDALLADLDEQSKGKRLAHQK